MSAQAISLSYISTSPFARDVAFGLSNSAQKSLPSQYLYDELGSILFDAITALPEYGLTRADSRVLKAHSGAIIAAMPGRKLAIAELGSGTGAKTRWVLEAAVAAHERIDYHPIDISETAVNQCTKVLETLQGVTIVPQAATYLEGLERVTRKRKPGANLLVLFLGSTIGNFDFQAAREFLSSIRALLKPGDGLLLGTDLIKPLAQMITAYDDPTGVTACFNLNLLGRINRELNGNFKLRQFKHLARFNDRESRIEMHLRSEIDQTVDVHGIERSFTFLAGETIWTEGSYKFRRSEIDSMARDTGFGVAGQWADQQWPFAETLLLA